MTSMVPTWFPYPLLVLGMQGTRETPGRPTMLLLASNALTLAPSYQGDNDLDSHLSGSTLQFSVRVFSMTLHDTVGDSFLPKAVLSIPRLERVHSPRRQTLLVPYHERRDFCRHRGSRFRSWCCRATGKLPRKTPGSCRRGKCRPSGDHGPRSEEHTSELQ